MKTKKSYPCGYCTREFDHAPLALRNDAMGHLENALRDTDTEIKNLNLEVEKLQELQKILQKTYARLLKERQVLKNALEAIRIIPDADDPSQGAPVQSRRDLMDV
jgi:gamma-glutamyl phosphate reductase